MRLALRIKVKKIFRNGKAEVPATLYYLYYYDVKVLLVVFFYKVLIERLTVSLGGHLFDKKLNVLAIAFGPESRLYPHAMLSSPFMPLPEELIMKTCFYAVFGHAQPRELHHRKQKHQD